MKDTTYMLTLSSSDKQTQEICSILSQTDYVQKVSDNIRQQFQEEYCIKTVIIVINQLKENKQVGLALTSLAFQTFYKCFVYANEEYLQKIFTQLKKYPEELVSKIVASLFVKITQVVLQQYTEYPFTDLEFTL